VFSLFSKKYIYRGRDAPRGTFGVFPFSPVIRRIPKTFRDGGDASVERPVLVGLRLKHPWGDRVRSIFSSLKKYIYRGRERPPRDSPPEKLWFFPSHPSFGCRATALSYWRDEARVFSRRWIALSPRCPVLFS